MVSDNGGCIDALTRYNVLVWVLIGMTLFMLFFRVAARRHIMAGNGKAGTRRAFASQPSTQPTGVPRACNGGAMACLCTLATCNIYGVVGERGAHAGRCAGGRGARMRRRSFSSLDPDTHSFFSTFPLISLSLLPAQRQTNRLSAVMQLGLAHIAVAIIKMIGAICLLTVWNPMNCTYSHTEMWTSPTCIWKGRGRGNMAIPG